jgi:hypothetical protein
METNAARTRVKLIEESLVYVVRLLAQMDSTAGFGGVVLIPDVFTWMLEQTNPAFIHKLSTLDLLDTFKRRLAQYQELRAIAEPLRFDNHLRAERDMCTELQDFGYLALSDIQYALDYGDWRPDDRSARLCFVRVLRTARVMPFPEDEMVTDLGIPQRFCATRTLPDMEHLGPPVEDVSASLDPRLPGTLEPALEHIRRELVVSDDGRAARHWAHIYTSILGGWLQEDLPEQVATVLAGGHVEAFFDELAQFRHQMEQVERIWNAMGETVRALVLRADEPTASLVIAEFVRADDTDEDEVSAWTSLLRNMVKRRGAAESSDEHEKTSDIVETHETSAVLEKIRSASSTQTTAYLISRVDLPESHRKTVHEQQCLAVRLPEERLEITASLSQAVGLECFYSERTGPNKVCETHLSIGRAFWCKYEALWPILFRFRRAIPVLFVFERQCILVQYPFEHFSDLRKIVDDRIYRRTVNISDGPWTTSLAQERLDTLPDGKKLKPSMLDQVVDLSELILTNHLADAYKAIHSTELSRPKIRIQYLP